QAGLGFGVESTSRQVVLNNAVALARTAVAFKVPVIASTSASRVYSGSLLPPLQEVLPSIKAIERRSMNAWEDDAARNAVGHAGFCEESGDDQPPFLSHQPDAWPNYRAGQGLPRHSRRRSRSRGERLIEKDKYRMEIR